MIPKISKTKTLFKNGIVELVETELALPNGKKKTHHNVMRRSTVSVFPLTQKLEIYLVSQYRYLHKKVSLEAMSGFIEDNETPLSGGKRELEEETGLRAATWKQLSTFEIAGSVVKSELHLFLAQDLSHGTTKFDDEEDIELVKIPLEEAVKKVLRGEINHAASAIGILMLDRLKREKKI